MTIKELGNIPSWIIERIVDIVFEEWKRKETQWQQDWKD